MASCPECNVEISAPNVSAVSEIIECGDCRSELEVVGVSPLRLATAPEIEEDWGE
ncbi:lysine biosynthesis protein LysW [uncultured Streptomyces sp.]|uniref:lysine biosynthesis protein LysW n=1 Tax=uncultured Streptomyces sp. TaxID=174707 RepID=UPI0026230EE4|nr:lysine biosynthesis protein LysW [uncultured Streptomyces sp.]